MLYCFWTLIFVTKIITNLQNCFCLLFISHFRNVFFFNFFFVWICRLSSKKIFFLYKRFVFSRFDRRKNYITKKKKTKKARNSTRNKLKQRVKFLLFVSKDLSRFLNFVNFVNSINLINSIIKALILKFWILN